MPRHAGNHAVTPVAMTAPCGRDRGVLGAQLAHHLGAMAFEGARTDAHA